jgi:hypothetical protein
MSVMTILATLRGRLPELEWQLNKMGRAFSPTSLPPGLFRQNDENPTSYVSEIKNDITTLGSHPNPRIVRYLAEKINQKINVLVSLCSRHHREQSKQEMDGLMIDRLRTRQQWLHSLEMDIKQLEEQKQALTNTLTEKDVVKNCAVSLNVRKELGNLEKHLTLLKETLGTYQGV